MKKIVCHIVLSLLLFMAGATTAWAEEKLPPKLQKLTEDAYRYYSVRDSDNFFEAIQRIKMNYATR